MTEQSKGWRAGDLAVCTNNIGWWEEREHSAIDGPALEQVLRVAGVYPGLGLEFDEFPDQIWPESEFRRIEPDHSAADDAEIVALIKRASERARARAIRSPICNIASASCPTSLRQRGRASPISNAKRSDTASSTCWRVRPMRDAMIRLRSSIAIRSSAPMPRPNGASWTRTATTGLPPSSEKRWPARAAPTFPLVPAFPLSAGTAPRHLPPPPRRQSFRSSRRRAAEMHTLINLAFVAIGIVGLGVIAHSLLGRA